jgi:superoxide dismutase
LYRTFCCSEPFNFTHVVQNLCPGGSGEPTGALAAAIQKDFGSFEAMKNQLSTASVAVQVSCPFLSLVRVVICDLSAWRSLFWIHNDLFQKCI